MSRISHDQSALNKVKISLFLGLLAAVFLGSGHAIFFIVQEKYANWELQRFLLYFLQYQVWKYTLILVPASLLLALLWNCFDEIEGLVIAALPVLVIALPLTYFINKRYLPSIRSSESIIGNSFLLLITLVLIFAIFIKKTRSVRLFHKLYSFKLAVVLLLLIIGLKALYALQPAHVRLQNVSDKVDQEFLAFFDFSHNGLAGLDETQDRLKVRESLLSYFSKRTPEVRKDIVERVREIYPDTSKVISDADAILRREFTLWYVTKQLPQRIDWYHNPTRERVWLFALDEFEWLWDVAVAYVLTGDEKYARDFDRIMQSFFDQVEPIYWKNEKNPVWRLIGAGLRMSGSWVDAFYVFLPSESVTEETKIKLLASIHDHAQFLAHFRSPRRNHLIQESYGLLKVGAMFPEFKMSDAWIDIAKKRLDREITHDVYPDGGYTEASIFYHRYVIRMLQEILDFSEDQGVKLGEEFYRQLEKMYDFLLYTARPDGVMPQLNDGFHARSLRKLYSKPAKIFDRKDYLFFATDGKEGTPPVTTSVAFPYTGIYVMRSDWSDAAQYLLFDGGLFGSAHGHEDKLSFELFAYGSPFIIEAGTFTYMYNRWHKYFESSQAHNTITVDGKSQLRAHDEENWMTEPHRKQPNKWVSTDDYDFVESTYDDGYGNVKEDVAHDVTHIRRMLFVKPDYWILWDVINGSGEHTYDQHFHFMPMPLEILDDGAVVTVNKGSANLLVQPLYADGLSVTEKIGEEEPIQGWISLQYGEKQPAPAVIYSKSAETPTVFVTVLFALRPDENYNDLTITTMPLSGEKAFAPEEGIALKIGTAGWSDYVVLAPQVTEVKQVEGYSTKKEFFLIRMENNGKARKRIETDL